jgi:C4-type Zn-finger protein
MIVYKIDKQSHSRANSQIQDMAGVLAEIPQTLQALLELVEQQEEAFSTPSFNEFRKQLQNKIDESIELTRTISEHSQKLAAVSEEATKHLMTIEDHFGAILRKTSQSQQQV